MRLIHLSDCHLGAKRFDKATRSGVNQREADILATWARVVPQVVALAPELVVIAGDVFDSYRPSNVSLMGAFQGVQRIAAVCPVIIIAGNHDDSLKQRTGAYADGCLLSLFGSIPRCYVVLSAPERLTIGDVSVLCVPERHAHEAKLEPLAGARTNILLLHGEIAGAIPGTKPGAHTIEPERWGTDWQYIALGHYHVTGEVAPRAWYAGSLDYTSPNVWGELRTEAERGYTGKGFLEVDTDTGHVTRHPITGARRWIDLPRINGAELSAETLDAQVTAHVEALGPLTDKPIVRQVITDVPTDRVHDMKTPHRRDWRSDMLAWQLDIRRPERQRVYVAGVAVARGKSLEEMLRESLARVQAEGIDKDALQALGAHYMAQATEKLGDAPSPLAGKEVAHAA